MNLLRTAAALAAACGFVCGLGAARLDAQGSATGGQVGGQVIDPQGAPIQGAAVTLRHVETNYSRTVTTDQAGRYAIGPIPTGAYEIVARPAGMQPASERVHVSLGGRSTVNFQVGLAGLEESVDVQTEPDQLGARSILTEIQLRNIPAPGRRLKNLFLQTPATQIEPECGGFSISGQKGVYTSFNVDGGDYTSSHFCGHVEMSPSFTIEALQEFQVLRGTFSAEYGRSTGGIINLATRSGTNRYAGSAFYLFRDDALTKDDPFGRQQIHRGHQFGGSAAGPLARDRTFFFVATEVQRNSKPVSVLYSQLDILGLRAAPGARALLDAAPESSLTAISELESVVSRVDHRISPDHGLAARGDITRGRVSNSVGSFINTNGLGADSITNRDVVNASPVSNRTNATGFLQLTSVLGPRVVNELRVQIAREYRPWNPGDGPEVTVRDGSPVRTIAIYGPQATGLGYGNVGYAFTDRRYQLVENVSFVSGAHTLKAGVDANFVFSRVAFNPGRNGIYRFDSLANYLARRPSQYTQFAGSGEVNAYKHQIALYVQDEWRVRRDLTISPGFRYEMALFPDYPAATVPGNRHPNATFIPDDREMFGPRLGLAWDPGQNGRTVVRAATGIFYAPPYISLVEQAMASNGGNPEISSNVNLNTLAEIQSAFSRFGIDLASAPLGRLPVLTLDQLNALRSPASRLAQSTSVFYFDENFRLPRAVHYRVALEQSLGRGIGLTVDYTQIDVSRMDRIRDLNLPAPTRDASGRQVYTRSPAVSVNALRPDRRFGPVYVTESTARSNYKGVTTTLSLRRPRVTADASYTLGFSRSDDDHENGGFSSAFYTDVNALENEYGWSNIDQRHQFAANGVVFLPRNIQAAVQMRLNSGRPFSPRTGIDSNRDGIVNDRPMLDGAVVRRNTFRNRGFSDVSLRLQKTFAFRGERGVSAFVEFFNVFDADNVETTQFVYGGDLAAPPANALFGQVRNADGAYLPGSALRTTPFQAQIGLRVQF